MTSFREAFGDVNPKFTRAYPKITLSRETSTKYNATLKTFSPTILGRQR